MIKKALSLLFVKYNLCNIKFYITLVYFYTFLQFIYLLIIVN